MDFNFTITDHSSAFQTGFAAVIVCWFIGWVIGQVINLIRYS
ncbi:hypothetical protein VSVS12_02730 [Vibrio scophthalmi]|nr:hypothetical protein VSVS12_02730 [Vibrio scophthalmi]